MAWTTPRTWVAGETLTSTLLNTHLRDNLTFIYGQFGVGWFDLTSYGAFTFNSVDGNTGVINTPANLTAVVPVGAKFQYVQGGVTKYAFVVAVAAGTITLYTGVPAVGVDYTLANATITAPNFSINHVPLGFSATPAKWRETMTNTSALSQATPTNGQWYNFGTTLGIFMPAGLWRARFKACGIAIGGSVGDGKSCGIEITLSTSLAGETNPESTGFGSIFADSATSGIQGQWTVEGEALLSTAARTTICLMARSSANSESSIWISGTTAATIITLECAYL